MPKEFQSQICLTRYPLFVHDLGDYSAPLIHHALFVGERSRPEIRESIGAQNEESIIGMRVELPVCDFWFCGNIRW